MAERLYSQRHNMMKGDINMEKRHSINFEDLFGDVEEGFFTWIIAIAGIAPFLYMFVK